MTDTQYAVTVVTGCVPTIPWWRLLYMTNEEIRAHAEKFFHKETVQMTALFDDNDARTREIKARINRLRARLKQYKADAELRGILLGLFDLLDDEL